MFRTLDSADAGSHAVEPDTDGDGVDQHPQLEDQVFAGGHTNVAGGVVVENSAGQGEGEDSRGVGEAAEGELDCGEEVAEQGGGPGMFGRLWRFGAAEPVSTGAPEGDEGVENTNGQEGYVVDENLGPCQL